MASFIEESIVEKMFICRPWALGCPVGANPITRDQAEQGYNRQK